MPPSARAKAVIAFATTGLLMVVACSSSSSSTDSSSPNMTSGQCVLSGDVWYCGAGYGNFPACPTELTEDTESGACTYDGGTCFACLYGPAGATCTCGAATGSDSGASGDGGAVWHCIPSETGCTP